MPSPQPRDAAGRFVAQQRLEANLVSLPHPGQRLLIDLDAAGYVTDEWARWQQGACGAYAIALCRLDPRLSMVVLGHTAGDGWHESHWYATDGTWAYDSAGRHPMPYLGIDDQCDYIEVDVDASEFGLYQSFGEEDFVAAVDHARRHNILSRDPVSTVGWS